MSCVISYLLLRIYSTVKGKLRI